MIFSSHLRTYAPRIALSQTRISCARNSTHKIPSREDLFTEKPVYPPIADTSKRAERARNVTAWYKKIERLVTIEEKLFEINVPRYWGWKCVMLREEIIPYNSLSFAQYITRTHILNDSQEPEWNKTEKDNNAKITSSLLPVIEEELANQLSLNRPPMSEANDGLSCEKENAKLIVNCIHRLLARELNPTHPHLNKTHVDYGPRLESFWSVGGIEPPESVKKRRKEEDGITEKAEIEEPCNRWVQYLGSPVLQVRHKHPLPAVWDPNLQGDVPIVTYDPEVIGFGNEYRHGTSIPGFWPGDEAEFSCFSYHLCNHLNHRPPSYGSEDFRESLLCQGILSSFSWLVSLAAYQGFSPFSEITYPFVTQAVLTDGKKFSFMVYQMNTNLVHSEFATNNPKVNFCWCTEAEDLYDRLEDGKLIGLNEKVLNRLINVYSVEPKERIGVHLKPYLGDSIQRIAHFEDDEKRSWLEQQFKHFSSNRPRHRSDLQYEIYEWERIYKIEHQTFPMDPRRRPFELKQHPYRRKMSDHPGEYIPRRIRPDKDLPKYKQRKFRKMFYPQ